jgi:predicted amidohydrolase
LRQTFGVAALQLALQPGDNLARIGAEVDALHRRMPWVEMVVLGELAIFGADPRRAEPMPGPAEAALAQIARRNAVWLVPGSMYESVAGATYNTAPVIAPNGDVVARHRKLYPFTPYECQVDAGSDFIVFEVPEVGCFGVSICYDMWFPETSRSLVHLGAEVILHPVMTTTIDRDVEIAMARATAACNQCYVVDVNVTGDLGVGRSLVCGPGGEVIHQAGEGREIIAVELDFTALRRARQAGWHGLGQPLKSFRDGTAVFPAYGAGAQRSTALDALGALRAASRPSAGARGA